MILNKYDIGLLSKKKQYARKYEEFFKFILIGLIATVLHYSIYWILYRYMNVAMAYSIGYGFSFICNFYLTSVFTFKSKATIRKGAGFSIAHIINYLLHLLLLNIFLRVGFSQDFAPIPVLCIVVPINFILVRYVYRRK